MHDVAWRGMWICVRSKDAQKQLARTSLNLAKKKKNLAMPNVRLPFVVTWCYIGGRTVLRLRNRFMTFKSFKYNGEKQN